MQDYDGTLRIAPAWPAGWDVSGTVSVQGNTKVDVQVQGGTPVTVAIQAGSSRTMKVRSPWPGRPVQVVNGSSNAVVVSSTTAATLSVPVGSGQSYLVEQVDSPTTRCLTRRSLAPPRPPPSTWAMCRSAWTGPAAPRARG